MAAQVAREKAFLEGLTGSGRVVIHGTTCYGQRECGPGDHDQSCHWGTDGKYYCLRCAPRQIRHCLELLPWQALLPCSTESARIAHAMLCFLLTAWAWNCFEGGHSRCGLCSQGQAPSRRPQRLLNDWPHFIPKRVCMQGQ